MMAHEGVVRAMTFESAALLRCLGFRFLRGERGARRVALCFEDADGKAAAALQRHDSEGVKVNSRDFQDALSWAKSAVFSVKDRDEPGA